MGTNYKHLSCEERTMIQLSLEQGCTLRAIARSVQRAPSSISRELNRNGWSNPTVKGVRVITRFWPVFPVDRSNSDSSSIK